MCVPALKGAACKFFIISCWIEGRLDATMGSNRCGIYRVQRDSSNKILIGREIRTILSKLSTNIYNIESVQCNKLKSFRLSVKVFGVKKLST